MLFDVVVVGAVRPGLPNWDASLLRRYEREHRRATRPLYLTTQGLASLYTDDRLPARALRKLALGACAHAGPFRRMVMAGLTSAGEHSPFRSWLPRLRA